jgi:hypothetical protein
MTSMDDAIISDQALGSEIVVDSDTFLVGEKPADRDALVESYEQFVTRWRKVALAARANRLRRKGAFDREMREWAAEHGSERLQVGLEDNFRMTAVYLEERLAAEFPGFYAWSESDPESHWRARVGPTETALHGRRQVQETLDEAGPDLRAEIVWLISPPEDMRKSWWDSDLADEDDTAPCEAIVVQGWLDRYTLVGPVSTEDAPIPNGYDWEPVFGSRPPVDTSDFQAAGGGDDDIPF